MLLEQKLRRSIAKSRPFFEQKEYFNQQLSAQKVRVENLQRAVMMSKQSYSESLQNLESISEEIHQKRKLLQPREPGVGAELSLPNPEFELNSCEYRSLGSVSATGSSTAASDNEDEEGVFEDQQVRLYAAVSEENKSSPCFSKLSRTVFFTGSNYL